MMKIDRDEMAWKCYLMTHDFTRDGTITAYEAVDRFMSVFDTEKQQPAPEQKTQAFADAYCDCCAHFGRLCANCVPDAEGGHPSNWEKRQTAEPAERPLEVGDRVHNHRYKKDGTVLVTYPLDKSYTTVKYDDGTQESSYWTELTRIDPPATAEPEPVKRVRYRESDGDIRTTIQNLRTKLWSAGYWNEHVFHHRIKDCESESEAQCSLDKQAQACGWQPIEEAG